MQNNQILTVREREVINKKLNNLRLNQQDSNYLSRFVRPKLKKIKQLDADYLLNRLNYNPKSLSIDKKIKNIILKNLKQVQAIILYGSIIQTGYQDYNDIDVLIITKEKSGDNKYDNYEICLALEKKSNKVNLKLHVQIISKKTFLTSYSSNPSLIYQLKDSKIIYGDIKIPNKINLSKMDLRMKLDWSDEDFAINPSELYSCIRNTILVRLLMNKIIDNSRLKEELIRNLGLGLVMRLKSNKATQLERKYALNYLNNITEQTRREIINAKWEKIEI